MIDVIIDGKKASGDFTSLIGLTLNLINFQDISSRSVTYTNQILLPSNLTNDAIFFNICNLLDKTLTNETVNLSCRILDNGSVIFDGYLVPIEMTVGVGYKLTLFSSQTDFLNKLNEVSIRTIFSEYWDAAVRFESLTPKALCLLNAVDMTNAGTLALLNDNFPLRLSTIDSGYLQPTGAITGTDLRWVCSLDKLLTIICNYAGFQNAWSPSNDFATAFKNYGYMFEPTWNSYSERFLTANSQTLNTTSTNSVSILAFPIEFPFPTDYTAYIPILTSTIVGSSDLDAVSTLVDGNVVIVTRIKFKSKFTPEVWFRATYNLGANVFDDEITGFAIQFIQKNLTTSVEEVMSNLDLSVDLRNSDLYFELPEFESKLGNYGYYARIVVTGIFRASGIGDIPERYITWDVNPITDSIYENPNAEAGTAGYELTNTSSQVDTDYPIEAAQIVPDIKCEDLIKFICNYGGLFPKFENQSLNFAELSQSDVNVIDWSGLVDFTDGVKLDFRNDNYGSDTVFQFKDDDNFVTDKVTIPVLGKSLPKTVVLYQAPFILPETVNGNLIGSFLISANVKAQTIKNPNRYFIWNLTKRNTNPATPASFPRYVKGDVVWDNGAYWQVENDVVVNDKPSTSGDYKQVALFEGLPTLATSPSFFFCDFNEFIQEIPVLIQTASTYEGTNDFLNVRCLSWASGIVRSTYYTAQTDIKPTFENSSSYWGFKNSFSLNRKIYVSVFLQPYNIAELLDKPNSRIYIRELSSYFYLMQLNQYYLGAQQLTQVILLPA